MIQFASFSNWLIGVILGVVLLIKADELCVLYTKGFITTIMNWMYRHYQGSYNKK